MTWTAQIVTSWVESPPNYTYDIILKMRSDFIGASFVDVTNQEVAPPGSPFIIEGTRMTDEMLQAISDHPDYGGACIIYQELEEEDEPQP